jgi:SAM-dependent methyltransferase
VRPAGEGRKTGATPRRSELRTLRRNWERLGEDDALWAILTDPGKRGRRWSLDEFLETGRAEVARVIAYLGEVAPTCPRRRAMDFGCGIGRVTRPLAAHFQEVTGVDVSSAMVRRAESLTGDGARCRFVVNAAPDLRMFGDEAFDFVYSRIVLQHIPPALVRGYLPEMLRVLAPGGVLLFQLPTPISAREAFLRSSVEGGGLKRHVPLPIVRAWRRLKYARLRLLGRLRITMHGLPRSEVLSILEANGGHLLDVRDDDAHGTAEPGYEYCCTKMVRESAS